MNGHVTWMVDKGRLERIEDRIALVEQELRIRYVRERHIALVALALVVAAFLAGLGFGLYRGFT